MDKNINPSEPNNCFKTKNQNFYLSYNTKSETRPNQNYSYTVDLNISSKGDKISGIKNVESDFNNINLGRVKEILSENETKKNQTFHEKENDRKGNFSLSFINPDYNKTIKGNYNYYIIYFYRQYAI